MKITKKGNQVLTRSFFFKLWGWWLMVLCGTISHIIP